MELTRKKYYPFHFYDISPPVCHHHHAAEQWLKPSEENSRTFNVWKLSIKNIWRKLIESKWTQNYSESWHLEVIRAFSWSEQYLRYQWRKMRLSYHWKSWEKRKLLTEEHLCVLIVHMRSTVACSLTTSIQENLHLRALNILLESKEKTSTSLVISRLRSCVHTKAKTSAEIKETTEHKVLSGNLQDACGPWTSFVAPSSFFFIWPQYYSPVSSF